MSTSPTIRRRPSDRATNQSVVPGPSAVQKRLVDSVALILLDKLDRLVQINSFLLRCTAHDDVSGAGLAGN